MSHILILPLYKSQRDKILHKSNKTLLPVLQTYLYYIATLQKMQQAS